MHQGMLEGMGLIASPSIRKEEPQIVTRVGRYCKESIVRSMI